MALNVSRVVDSNKLHLGALSQALRPVSQSQIPPRHPVRIAYRHFELQAYQLPPQRLPDLNDFFGALSDRVRSYSMLLEPIAARFFIDYRVIYRGMDIPWAQLGPLQVNQLYTDDLEADQAKGRVLEIAAGLALRQPSLTVALSARVGLSDLVVFRGLLPLWCSQLQKPIAMIVAAEDNCLCE